MSARFVVVATAALLLATTTALQLQAPPKLRGGNATVGVNEQCRDNVVAKAKGVFQRGAQCQYSGLCLKFTYDSIEPYHVVSTSCLAQRTAADAARACRSDHRWHPYSGTDIPKGAAILFEDCNAPANPDGHAVVSVGGGLAASTGVCPSGFEGSSHVEISWLVQHYCNSNPSGWIEFC